MWASLLAPPTTPVLVLSGPDLLARGVLPIDETIQCQIDAFRAESTTPARLVLANARGEPTLFKPSICAPAKLQTKVTSALADAGQAKGANSQRENEDEQNDTRQLIGVKVVSVRSNNVGGLPTVPGAVLLINDTTGLPQALLDGTVLTALRTAAGSAACMQEFLKADPGAGIWALRKARLVEPASIEMGGPSAGDRLVIFGAGMQALAHAAALVHVLTTLGTLSRVTFVNRTEARALHCAHDFAVSLQDSAQMSKLRVDGLAANAPDLEDVIRAATVIACCTGSSTPLFAGSLVSPGTLICAIGSYQPHSRELDDSLIQRCLIVPDVYGALETSGDLAIPMSSGVISKDQILCDFSEMVRQPDVEHMLSLHRRRDLDVFLFKSVGTALQDICTAGLAVVNCKRLGLGHTVNL